jgi:hypothetical protein
MTNKFKALLFCAASLLATSAAIAAAPTRPSGDIFAAGPRFAAPAAWTAPIAAVLMEAPGAKGRVPDEAAVQMVAQVLAHRGTAPADRLAAVNAVKEAAAQMRAKLRDDWKGDKLARQIESTTFADEAAVRTALSDMERVERAMPWFDQGFVALSRAVRADALARWKAVQSDRLGRRIAELSEQLSNADRGKAAGLVWNLKQTAESAEAPDSAKIFAAQALSKHLRSSYGVNHSRQVVDALTWIGLSSPSPALHQAVVEGLADDLTHAKSSVAANRPALEISALATVASASQDPVVKAFARDALRPLSWQHSFSLSGLLSWLVFDRNRPARPFGFRSAVRAAIAQVAVASPSTLPTEEPPAPPRRSLRDGSRRLLAEHKKAVRWSWLNTAALGFIAPLYTFFSLVADGVPVVAAIPAVFLALGVAGYGYTKQHPLMGLVHMSVISGLFVSATLVAAATGPIGFVGYALTFAYAGVLAALSGWTMRTHRPFLGALVLIALAALL